MNSFSMHKVVLQLHVHVYPSVTVLWCLKTNSKTHHCTQPFSLIIFWNLKPSNSSWVWMAVSSGKLNINNPLSNKGVAWLKFRHSTLVFQSCYSHVNRFSIAWGIVKHGNLECFWWQVSRCTTKIWKQW